MLNNIAIILYSIHELYMYGLGFLLKFCFVFMLPGICKPGSCSGHGVCWAIDNKALCDCYKGYKVGINLVMFYFYVTRNM